MKEQLEELQKIYDATKEETEKAKMSIILRNEAIRAVQMAIEGRSTQNLELRKENEELQLKLNEQHGRPYCFEVHKGALFKSSVKVSQGDK